MAKMKLSPLNCTIEIFSSINPSEDPNKIESAIENIFPNCKISFEKFSIKGSSNDLFTLEKIQENIDSMHFQRIYQRELEKNLNQNSTWFYINKQAAFAKKIVICEDADESPLGPIKIILTSKNIDRIIDWLILGEDKFN